MLERRLPAIGHALVARRPEPPSASPPMRVTIVAARLWCRSATGHYVCSGYEGSALHPQQEQNWHPPIFFLLPLTRSRRRAGVHAPSLRRTP
jgi:hypothetical protein